MSCANINIPVMRGACLLLDHVTTQSKWYMLVRVWILILIILLMIIDYIIDYINIDIKAHQE